ncbi:MAG: nucleoside-diphosphate kinase [Armatimonadia bacterium]|nr:nucleoside-diphosphate kinase [Armatimonadia bacterium]
MSTQMTLAIVKPDCFAEGHAGEVVHAYESEGLRLIGAMVVSLNAEHAAAFYAEHAGKPFFGSLLEYMTSGPVLVLALEGDDAISKVRRINGATDPEEAEAGTLRDRFGKSITNNAVHASANGDDAKRELAFFFPELAR